MSGQEGANVTEWEEDSLELFLEGSEELGVHQPTQSSSPLVLSSQGSSVGPGQSGSGSASASASTPLSSQTSEQGDEPSLTLRSPPTSRGKGRLWDSFSRVADNPCVARCNLCHTLVRRGNDPRHLSSSVLSRHLATYHPTVAGSQTQESLRGPATGQEAGGRKRPAPGGQLGSGAGHLTPPAKKKAATTGVARQATLTELVPMGQMWNPGKRGKGKAQEKGNRILAETVALMGLPLSCVEHPAFQRMLHYFAPWYELPSRRTFARRFLPELYSSVREKLREELGKARTSKVHFTMDLWSGGHHGYLAITAHWWQPDDLRVSHTSGGSSRSGEQAVLPPGYRAALLQARNLEGSATGRNISEELTGTLQEWGLEAAGVRGHMVTDAGRNMLAALNAAGFEGVVCMAHKLHLVVRDAIGLGSKVSPQWDAGTQETHLLLEKCRKLVGHFSRSLVAARLLRERQEGLGLGEHVLLLDMPTRWNSTYAMISRLVEQRVVLEDIMSSTAILPGGREVDISSREWLALAQMVEVLKPFKDTSDILCQQAASLGQVIPLIRAMEHTLLPSTTPSLLPRTRALMVRLRSGVRKRLLPLCHESVYRMASVCDPRLKATLAESSKERQELRAELVRAVREHMGGRAGQEGEGTARPEGEQGEPAEAAGASSETTSSRPVSQYWSQAVNWLVSQAGGASQRGERDPVALMVREYLSEPTEPPSSDPLQYWARRATSWPELATVAMNLLSCPPTSVQSERVFSHLGDLLRPRHSRLDPVSIERLAFIKVNLPLLGYP